MEWIDFLVFLCFLFVSELKICVWSFLVFLCKIIKELLISMLENFFKGEVLSIFEIMIKWEKGLWLEDNLLILRLKNYRNEEEFLWSVKVIICYCGFFWIFGMVVVVIGLILFELGCVINWLLNVMSWVFFL